MIGKRSKARSRYKGMTQKCRHCKHWTPNRGGVCCGCLDRGVMNLPRAEPPKVLSADQINKLLKEKFVRGEPHAVLRGRGLSVRR